MAKQLGMGQINSILTLHNSGHSNRKIAAILGINRETVARYLRDAQANPAKLDHRVQPGPTSSCEPFREQILCKLEQGLNGQRIYQDLRGEAGFDGSYSSVRRFIVGLRQNCKLPVRRIETEAGQEAQVDFGTGAWVQGDTGKRRRPWVFRIVLSCSRKAYSEAVWRQSTDSFLNCLENAFVHFGGVPKQLVIDNLKAAVKRADWYDPELHPKIQSFAVHYGTVFLPTKPYTPEHKGKVEGGVKYVKQNALAGRTFRSLMAQNDFLLDWESRIADTRIHGTTKKQVGKLFLETERDQLLPLASDRFPSFEEGRRSIHRDGYAEIDKAYYSAPSEYVGRRVWARWDSRLVRLYNDRWEQIALHAKVEAGKFQTAPQHIPKEKVSSVERGTDALLRQIESIGPHSRDWGRAIVQARGVEAVRTLIGLKALVSKHEIDALEQACKIALSHGAYRLRTIRQLVTRVSDGQQEFDFIDEHPVIRPLSDYSLESLLEFRKERNA